MFISVFEDFKSLGKIEVKTKKLDKKIIEISMRKKLNKHYDFQLFEDFFQKNNLKVPICNICKSHHVPYSFKITIESGLIKILGVNLLKKYQYCYAKSDHCAKLSAGRKMNPNSAKFISLVTGVSETEAKQYIRNNNKSTFYRENFNSYEEYKNAQKRDLKYFVSKYGDKEGQEKYKSAIRKQNYKRSKEFYIKKFGPLKGIEKYLKYNRARTNKFRGTSKWSLKLINRVLANVDKESFDKIMFGNKEYSYIDVSCKKTYFCDFYIEKDGKTKVVEFNGHAWHAPPNLSESEKLQWKPARGNRSWADVHKGDIRKYNTLRCAGFEVLVVWDFEDEEQIVEKILDFLND